MFTFFQARHHCYSLTFSAGFPSRWRPSAAAVVRVAVCLPARAYFNAQSRFAIFPIKRGYLIANSYNNLTGVSLPGFCNLNPRKLNLFNDADCERKTETFIFHASFNRAQKSFRLEERTLKICTAPTIYETYSIFDCVIVNCIHLCQKEMCQWGPHCKCIHSKDA